MRARPACAPARRPRARRQRMRENPESVRRIRRSGGEVLNTGEDEVAELVGPGVREPLQGAAGPAGPEAVAVRGAGGHPAGLGPGGARGGRKRRRGGAQRGPEGGAGSGRGSRTDGDQGRGGGAGGGEPRPGPPGRADGGHPPGRHRRPAPPGGAPGAGAGGRPGLPARGGGGPAARRGGPLRARRRRGRRAGHRAPRAPEPARGAHDPLPRPARLPCAGASARTARPPRARARARARASGPGRPR